jgi:hypothetical protein
MPSRARKDERKTDAAKRELAKDVTALANAGEA